MAAQQKHMVPGITLVAIGALFLLAQVFNFSIFGVLWPLLIILPGAAFLYAAFSGGKKQSGLAVPGSIITGTGLILMFQNLTGHWESWAYIWALYPVFLGWALSFMGQRTQNESVYETGRGFIRWGGISFVALAAFFELMIFDHGALGNLLLPIVLIGGGAWMLFHRQRPQIKEKRKVTFSKAKNDYSPIINEDLQRRIDQALAEEESEPVQPSQNHV